MEKRGFSSLTDSVIKPIIRLKTKTHGEAFAKIVLLTFTNIKIAQLANERGDVPLTWLALAGAGLLGIPGLIREAVKILSPNKTEAPKNEVYKETGTTPLDSSDNLSASDTPTEDAGEGKKSVPPGALDHLSGKELNQLDKDFGDEKIWRRRK